MISIKGKIRVIGKYVGEHDSIIIGGVKFVKGKVADTLVTYDQFTELAESDWFEFEKLHGDKCCSGGTGEEGSAGGTSNYEELANLPRINGVVLQGDKTGEEIGIPVSKINELCEKVDIETTVSQAIKKDLSSLQQEISAGLDKILVSLQ